MGKIEKKSGEFRGNSRCRTLREYDDIQMTTAKNSNYDNAVIVKEIIRGVFKGDFEKSEVPELVDEGIEDDFLSERQGELRKKRLSECILRYLNSEDRKPYFPKEAKKIVVGNYRVSVKPDAIFYTPGAIELVIYRAGKPDVKQNGRLKDKSPMQCLELWFLIKYGKTLLKKGEKKIVRASYYFLRKSTDSKDKAWDMDFFSDEGGNVVFLEDTVTGGSSELTDIDKNFMPQLQEFEEGEQCSEDDCRNCRFKVQCYYQKEPEKFERKTLGSKNGKITPSDAQQRIIDFRKGVCRVNAVAGSGKTECMTERGARMFEEGVKPSEVLFITFTDAGAYEMKERIAKKCEARGLAISMDDIQAMTFNTFAYRIVKANYADCGFTKPPVVIDDVRNYVIITKMLNDKPVVSLDYLNFNMNMPNCRGALPCAARVFELIKTLGLNPKEQETIDKLRLELQDAGLYRFTGDTAIQQLCDMYEDYDKFLKEDNLLQFADQEPLMNLVLEKHPGYLDQFGFRHVIVDEFQDSNDVQLATIQKLTKCPSFESLMVVGDDAQSIYGFRHTTPENILNFFEKIGIDGEDMYLVENRRSVPEILELADKVIEQNKERVEKQTVPVRDHGTKPTVMGFHDKKKEYAAIADQMERLLGQGMIPEDIAFIAAKKAELIAMASVLSEKKIPWIMKNPMPLHENSRVQAAISLADAFYQPDAEILYFNYMVAKYDGELVYEKTASEIMEEISEMKECFMNIDLLEIEVQKQIFHNFLDTIAGEDEIYQYFLELVYANEDFQSELEYIQNFKKFGESTAKKMEQSYQGIVLTTAHSSKGLEWPAVFLSVTNFDAKPLHSGRVSEKKQKQLEEKRRLLYVSMTRARDLLYITGQYVAYGKKGDYTYNQFLREIFESAGMEYCPIQVEEKPVKRGKRTKVTSSNVVLGKGMTQEQIVAYEKKVKGAKQATLKMPS